MDNSLWVIDTLYVTPNSQKCEGKVLKKHILKYIVPSQFNTRIETLEAQKKHQSATEDQQIEIIDSGNQI